MQSQYYEERLYPLQDGAMNTISKCGVRFYLTGGTALSRGYYNHRYSDDLDFFVNNDEYYKDQMKIVFSGLKDDGFFWDPSNNFISNESFTSFKIGWNKSDTLLKLDFVNDMTNHIGDIVKTGVYDRTDCIRNMLSNKLTALFRFAGKDVADIREIALREKVNWKQAIQDAQLKEAGLDSAIIVDILRGIPQKEFEIVAWKNKPEWSLFQQDIKQIMYEILSGEQIL